ncbi:MAG: glutaredoxin family protein [Lyngbya sp. HA4199-MV5]|nr:glutaredoxin family protein [Lyngbya sp. HA4199-MV5]
MHIIFYSKPGCHLCEGLQEKLIQIQSLDLELEVRDITTRDDWFQAYQYEIPVLVLEKRQEAEGRRQEAEGAGEAGEAMQNSELHLSSFDLYPSSFIPLPRPSPRATVQQLEQMLRKYL